ncbi:hypothetical protein ACRRTK_012517 [Alexandromys fortis]
MARVSLVQVPLPGPPRPHPAGGRKAETWRFQERRKGCWGAPRLLPQDSAGRTPAIPISCPARAPSRPPSPSFLSPLRGWRVLAAREAVGKPGPSRTALFAASARGECTRDA